MFSRKSFYLFSLSALASAISLTVIQPAVLAKETAITPTTPAPTEKVEEKTKQPEPTDLVKPNAIPKTLEAQDSDTTSKTQPTEQNQSSLDKKQVEEHKVEDIAQSKDSDAKESEENKDKSIEIVKQAELYLYGDGVKADLAKAAQLYAQAAELGNPKAMMRLSTMYRRGQGVDKNETEAFNLVRKSAELGYPAAQASLGAFYRDGTGVAKDYGQYRYWTKKAAENGHIMAMIMEANALEDDKDNPNAKGQAQDYVNKVKSSATPLEIYSIAYSYHHGLRLPQDDEKALLWAMEAAEREEVNAMYLLGELRWTQRNFQEAINWFEKAAEKGLVAAQLQTGRIYKEGEEGIRPNAAKAVKWLTLAAQSGEKEDVLSLAILLKTGPSSVQDTKKAQQWLEIYLEDANPDELHELAEKYWKGIGVRKNYDIAGAVALASLQKGDQRYLCEFAEQLATPNWIKSDFVTAYALLNDCVLETPDDQDLQNQFNSLENRMSTYQLQRAQQMDSQEALENYLKTHKPNIE